MTQMSIWGASGHGKVAADAARLSGATVTGFLDDAGGVFDFHGLRHTFLTNLARSGVHPRIMQALARHSDPRLTLGRYTHTDAGEQADALALLPDLSGAVEAQRATGTDGKTLAGDLADCLARTSTESFNSVQSQALLAAQSCADGELRLAPENAAFADDSRAVSEVRLAGFEPATYGLGNRCSIP